MIQFYQTQELEFTLNHSGQITGVEFPTVYPTSGPGQYATYLQEFPPNGTTYRTTMTEPQVINARDTNKLYNDYSTPRDTTFQKNLMDYNSEMSDAAIPLSTDVNIARILADKAGIKVGVPTRVINGLTYTPMLKAQSNEMDILLNCAEDSWIPFSLYNYGKVQPM